MAEITAALVKELREKSGAGMMDCKKALSATAGDLEKAMDELRKQGLATAQKKSARATKDGAVDSYIHAGGKIGVLIELNCESDFVARTDDFQTLLREIALQVAAANPQYVSREEVPADIIEREKSVYRAQMENSGKPPQVIEKIVEGKLGSFYEQACLVDQPSIRDPKLTVKAMLQAAIAKLGENISVARFVRFKVGEAR